MEVNDFIRLMMFISKSKLISKCIKRILSKINLILFASIVAWISFNIYFLPFAVWTSGIVRPWFIAHGLTPYKDFTWLRTPFDIYLLSLWHSIFGFTEFSYQLFVFFILIVNAFLLFLITRKFFKNSWVYSMIFYAVFLFPLFLNTEEGELLIGAFFLMIIFSMLSFFKDKKQIWLFITGVVSGLIYITKQNASLIAGVIVLSIMLDLLFKKDKIVKLLTRIGIFTIGVLIPIATLSLHLLSKGAIGDFLYYTVYFILSTYRRHQPNLIQDNGILIAVAFLLIFTPFIIFLKDTKQKPQIVVFLILSFFASLFSLLPSLLSYRAFPSFGIISIIAGILFWILFKKETRDYKKGILLLSISLFGFFAYQHTQAYIDFIFSNPIKLGQYITDYGESDKKIAEWIRANTKSGERIQSFSNEIIYVLSDRLPRHKYIEPFPLLLRPFEQTSKLFINEPPIIVTYDTSLPQIHKGLESWGFIKFLEKRYEVVGKFNETIFLYQFNK